MSLTRLLRDPGEEWPYTASELPTVFGAPANPLTHPLHRRIAYGLTAILVGVTGALGNALVFVNQPQLQGALGLYASEIAWLPTAYVMAIIPMNLLLVKFRAQFGLRVFVLGAVGAFTLVMLAHLFAHTFASSVAVRAASGMVGAAFTTQSIFYMAQALPLRWRLQGIVIGLGIPQFSVPLARCLFSSELLALGEWRSLYLCELGLTLLSLGAVILNTLPPAPRRATYEWMDLVTFAVFASGMAAVAAVVGLGRYLWWHDTPWLGYALALSVPLLIAAFLIERHRANPLFAMDLLLSGPFLRFIVLSLLLQIAVTEQTVGAVGLLNAAGLNNDQLHPLFWLVTVAMVVGLLSSVLVLRPDWFAQLVAPGFLTIAIAALIDSRATNLTRPEQLYTSQFLVGFAVTFTMGPLFLYGLRLALPKGEAAFISFLAVFSITANLGGLAASSLMTTYETLREKTYSHYLSEYVTPSDPSVVTGLAKSSHPFRAVTADTSLRVTAGATQLGERVTRESTVLAYIDVFQAIALVTVLTAASLVGLILWRRYSASAAVSQPP
jgi:MFS family permease